MKALVATLNRESLIRSSNIFTRADIAGALPLPACYVLCAMCYLLCAVCYLLCACYVLCAVRYLLCAYCLLSDIECLMIYDPYSTASVALVCRTVLCCIVLCCGGSVLTDYNRVSFSPNLSPPLSPSFLAMPNPSLSTH